MESKMNELDFYEFSLEVSYGKNQEFEVTIDKDRNEPIEAEVEDELKNEFLQGRDAFDYIFERVEKLEITSDSERQNVIDKMLEAFDLSADYTEFDLEIDFNDGKQLDIEDRK